MGRIAMNSNKSIIFAPKGGVSMVLSGSARTCSVADPGFPVEAGAKPRRGTNARHSELLGNKMYVKIREF